ncbi:hypothetical protein D3C76_869340 [compost metagenome]
MAASLGHDAQAAEGEHLQRHRAAGRDLAHLRQGQHPRQHGTTDTVVLVVEGQRRRVGRRALHRQVQRQVRMAPCGIAEHRAVGGDQGVHTEVGGVVHSALPAPYPLGAWIGVHRDIHLPAGVAHTLQAFLQLALIQVEAGEMAGVGVVAKTDVDGVRAFAQGGLEGGQTARRTYQLHASPNGRIRP